jgi:RNA polymerase sigma-70 factor, ECF subfamily
MSESPSGQPDLRSAEELAAAARSGSSACFEALVDRFGPRLLRYLRHRIGDSHAAEDLLQETFFKVHRNLRRYDASREFAPWVFTIATRLAISHHRRRRTPIVANLDRADQAIRDPGQEAASAEERENLWALSRGVLNAEQFTALWLRYAEEMPLAQIAAATGRSTGAVKLLLHRARGRLTTELTRAENRSVRNERGTRRCLTDFT